MNIREHNSNLDTRNKPCSKNTRTAFRFKKYAIALLITLMTVTGGGYWLLNTATGLQWLLSAATRMSNEALQIEGINGTVSALQIDRLYFHDETLQLAVQQLKLDWSPGQLLTGKLLFHEISAQLLDVHTAPAQEEDTEETTLPDNLELPIAISLKNLFVDKIRIYSMDDDQSGRQPDFSLADLSIRLESHAQQHQIKHLSFNSMFGALEASAQIRSMRPFKLDATIQLDNAEKWGVTHAVLTGSLKQLGIQIEHHHQPMQGTINAQLQPFAQNPLAMITSLRATITEFNPATLLPDKPEIPKANLALQATFNQNNENQLTGILTLRNSAIAPLDQNGVPLAGISTAILMTDETLKLGDLKIQLPEQGLIDGIITWQFEEAIGLAELSVSNLNPSAIDTQLQAAKINGLVQLTGDADEQHVNIKLNDQSLKLDAAVTRTAGLILLEQLDLRHGQSSLTGKGEFNPDNEDKADDRQRQSFHFTGQLRQFNIADFVKAPESSLNTKLTLAGSLSPELSARLDYQFEKSHFNQQPVTGKGRITFEQPLVLTSKADFQVGSNQVTINGQFGKPGDALALNIAAPSLTQIGLGLAGAIKAQIDLKGTMDLPLIDFDIDSEKLALPGHHAFENLSAEGKLHEEALSLILTVNQYRSGGETQIKQLNLKVSGKKSWHTLQTDLRIDDEMAVTMQADGGIFGLDKPATTPNWRGQLSHLSVSGQVPVQLQAPTAINLSSEQVLVNDAQFAIAGGLAVIDSIFWSPENWESSGHFTGIGLHPESDLIPQDKILRLGGQWAVQNHGQLKGEVEISREKGDWHLPGELPQPIGLQMVKLHASARDNQLTGKLDLISAHIGKVKARITLPVTYSKKNNFFPSHTKLDGQLSLKAADLSWLDHLMDNPIQTAGQVELQASIAGTLDQPILEGDIRGENLAVALLDHGLDLQQGQLAASFNQSALHINKLSFMSPNEAPPKDRLLNKLQLEDKPGSLEISGSLGFADNTHQLTVALDHIYLVNPPHYWIVASGKSTVQMLDNVIDLSGELIANAGLIMQPPVSRPQLADDIIVAENKTESQEDSQTDEQTTIVNLHATLDLGKQFFLRVAGLEGRLDGSLQMQNDESGDLSVVGSIATRQTTFKAYGQDLTVERGIVNFQGPIDDPGLNILAVRKGLEVEAGVEIAGSVRHPRIKLVSTPHVPDTEKLSWIALGRAPDASGLDSSLLITAASSILGGESGGITSQISDMLGVDEISFRQGSTTPSGSLTNPVGLASSTLGGQIGTVGKRISSRAYLSYERGITTATAGITKLTYNLTPKITVVTQAGEDSAIDLFYTFRFD